MQVCPALWHFITCGPVSTTTVRTHRGSITSKSFPCSPFTVMLSGALATPGHPSSVSIPIFCHFKNIL